MSAACHRGTGKVHATAMEAPAPDSLRGTVIVTGAEPQTTVTLRMAVGGACGLEGRSAELRAVSGLEVVVWGRRDDGVVPPMPDGSRCHMMVSEFAVRRADGLDAVDGILRADGDAFVLEVTRGERRALAAVPATLRPQIGARIYWIGPLDRAPAGYGVISGGR